MDEYNRLEEKVDKMSSELEKICRLLSGISLHPDKVHVENLHVGQIDFHLDKVSVEEVSGALNIGITNGLNLNGQNKNLPQDKGALKKFPKPDINKPEETEGKKASSPQYKINFR